jgi:hypothetical protein
MLNYTQVDRYKFIELYVLEVIELFDFVTYLMMENHLNIVMDINSILQEHYNVSIYICPQNNRN